MERTGTAFMSNQRMPLHNPQFMPTMTGGLLPRIADFYQAAVQIHSVHYLALQESIVDL